MVIGVVINTANMDPRSAVVMTTIARGKRPAVYDARTWSSGHASWCRVHQRQSGPIVSAIKSAAENMICQCHVQSAMRHAAMPARAARVQGLSVLSWPATVRAGASPPRASCAAACICWSTDIVSGSMFMIFARSFRGVKFRALHGGLPKREDWIFAGARVSSGACGRSALFTARALRGRPGLGTLGDSDTRRTAAPLGLISRATRAITRVPRSPGSAELFEPPEAVRRRLTRAEKPLLP
mmetsp:Transcript_22722/g.70266  ORF Transcript_22722/g.70266 Transcript_22722/m.70266 type:complete len:240 (-) Transcript_22722:177-896(-)